MIFGKKKSAIDWLVVGLGNPGMAYEHTRHNAGYDALCVLAKEAGIRLDKKQFKALTGTGEIAGKKVMLLFPQTFMNNSGEAVQAAMAFYKLSADQLLVLSDDIALNPGVVRVRGKGSDGGQKGLRSIICDIEIIDLYGFFICNNRGVHAMHGIHAMLAALLSAKKLQLDPSLRVLNQS